MSVSPVVIQSLNDRQRLRMSAIDSAIKTDDHTLMLLAIRAAIAEAEADLAALLMKHAMDMLKPFAHIPQDRLTLEAITKITASCPIGFKDDPNGGLLSEIPIYLPKHLAQNIARDVLAHLNGENV